MSWDLDRRESEEIVKPKASKLDAFRSNRGVVFRVDDKVVSDNGTPGEVTLIMPFGVYVIFDGNKDGVYIEGALGIRPQLKEKTVSETKFRMGDSVYMLGHDNKPSYGTVFTIVGLSEDGNRADLRYDGVRYMSSVETKNLTPFVEGLKSKLAKQIGDEPKFRVGDKVRTVVGTVTDVSMSCVDVEYPDNGSYSHRIVDVELVERPIPEPKFNTEDRVIAPYGGIMEQEFVVWDRKFHDDIWVYILDSAILGDRSRPAYFEHELKMAPKPEPKLGSVWLCNYFKYVYVGNGRYADLGGNPTDSLCEEKEFSSPLEKVK
jgi:hypothetical protein